VAAARKTQTRNRYVWLGTGLAVLVALVVVIAVVVVNRSGQQQTAGAGVPIVVPATPITTATGRSSVPPWPVPADVADSVHQAGLPMLGAEGTAEHIHVHLDILVDGRAVTVPALVGIDEAGQQISPLHTHDTSGVIHIESPKPSTFSLGQFFTEWQVALSADHIGGLAAGGGEQLRAYVNGKQVSGDPAAITFTAHDEIALVYGSPTAKVTVPSGYNWPQGL
jgi:hypothetical protein